MYILPVSYSVLRIARNALVHVPLWGLQRGPITLEQIVHVHYLSFKTVLARY